LKIKLLVVGKTDNTCLQELISDYKKRINNLSGFEMVIIPDIKNNKNLSQNLQKEKEGSALLQKLLTSDYVVLLDENGKNITSRDFAGFLQKQMNSGLKTLVFVIGGPYGFSKNVYKRANFKIALSQMTFSHQLVRLIFLEQLYRGLAILNNHPYHHD